jgi:hypothetical protein
MCVCVCVCVCVWVCKCAYGVREVGVAYRQEMGVIHDVRIACGSLALRTEDEGIDDAWCNNARQELRVDSEEEHELPKNQEEQFRCIVRSPR